RARSEVEIVTEVRVTRPAPQTPPGGGAGTTVPPSGPHAGPSAPGATTAAAQKSAHTPPVTYTASYKGRKARLVSRDGMTVALFDRDADKVYTLDTAHKT